MSCAYYITTMRSIADELAFIGQPVSDEDLAMYILGGLGLEYNSFVVVTTTSYQQNNFSLANIQAQLQSHENLLNTPHTVANSLPTASDPMALYSNQKHRPPNYNNSRSNNNPYQSNQYQSRPRGPHPSGPRPSYQPPLLPNPNSPARPQTTIVQLPYEFCQICFKKGHSAIICWWRFDASRDSQFQSPPQAYIDEPITASNSSTDWILDSRASHHVTSDINHLSNFVPYEGFNQLHIGNGTGMQILHIGSTSFSIANTTIQLKNVLHVPSFTKNLLSLSQLLLDNSLLIEFFSHLVL